MRVQPTLTERTTLIEHTTLRELATQRARDNESAANTDRTHNTKRVTKEVRDVGQMEGKLIYFTCTPFIFLAMLQKKHK